MNTITLTTTDADLIAAYFRNHLEDLEQDYIDAKNEFNNIDVGEYIREDDDDYKKLKNFCNDLWSSVEKGCNEERNRIIHFIELLTVGSSL